jgi:uncharacterized protein
VVSIDLTVEVVRGLYGEGGGAHDFDHVLRVVLLAERIGATEGADACIVRTAALLHDIGESRGRADHHTRGAAMARDLLSAEPPEFVDAVAHAIEAHRFRADPVPVTLEARVVSDADKLDAIGAIGIARAFAYAGARGTPLWRRPWREIAAEGREMPQHPAPDTYTPVHEWLYKLDQVQDRLYTEAARTIARERSAVMQQFFDRLDDELLNGC